MPMWWRRLLNSAFPLVVAKARPIVHRRFLSESANPRRRIVARQPDSLQREHRVKWNCFRARRATGDSISKVHLERGWKPLQCSRPGLASSKSNGMDRRCPQAGFCNGAGESPHPFQRRVPGQRQSLPPQTRATRRFRMACLKVTDRTMIVRDTEPV